MGPLSKLKIFDFKIKVVAQQLSLDLFWILNYQNDACLGFGKSKSTDNTYLSNYKNYLPTFTVVKAEQTPFKYCHVLK